MAGFMSFIFSLVYLGVAIYMILLLTRFVTAVERIAGAIESNQPRLVDALNKIAEKHEQK